MSRVLVLGSSGMMGHMLALWLGSSDGFQVIDAGPRKKVFASTLLSDLTDPGAVKKLVVESSPDVIVNCVGVLIDAAERSPLSAILLNSALPHMLSTLCSAGAAKLIQLSSDCVFSGVNGPYRESEFRDGNGYYDRTKALGEVTNGRDLTIRTSITGPELNPNGGGLFNWFMLQRGEIRGYARALWSGVMTTQLARFIGYVIKQRPELAGIIHYSTPGGISKYELLGLFNRAFSRNIRIEPVDDPVVDKRLIDTRGDFDAVPPSYDIQVEDMKRWVRDHRELYGHYGLT